MLAETIEHPGSRDTYNTIANWIYPSFPYSSTDKWDRYGFIGVFADYVCSCTQGEILEIGAGESSIYLTKVAQKYNRRIWHCDVSASKLLNPMSIPGYIGYPRTYFEEREPIPNLERVVCYAGTSDSMFKRLPIGQVAIAFIDGDHIYEQAKRDFNNLWPLVVEDGYVLLHDTYPPDIGWTDENHCGEVYRLRQEIEKMLDADCLTLTKGTAIGVGLTIVRKHRKGYEF